VHYELVRSVTEGGRGDRGETEGEVVGEEIEGEVVGEEIEGEVEEGDLRRMGHRKVWGIT
jgi:hypothetical protein